MPLLSRLSFPGAGPPDPGTAFEAPGSLMQHRFRHLLERFSNGHAARSDCSKRDTLVLAHGMKGFRRVLEAVLKGF